MSAIPSNVIRNTFTACKNFTRSKNFEKTLKIGVSASVVGLWGAQTKLEMDHCEKEDKKNLFLNNLVIGAAMFIGGFAGHKGIRKLTNPKNIQKAMAKNGFLKNIFNKAGEILRKFPSKDYLEALSIPVGSGIAGGIAGEFSQEIFPVKKDKYKKDIEKLGNFIDLNYGAMGRFQQIPSGELIKEVHPSFSTMLGFSVGKEEGAKNKVKKFVYEIISGVLVPFTAVLPVARFLSQKYPDKKSLVGLISSGISISASFAGKTVATWFNKKVTDKVVEDEFWQKVEAKKRELIRHAIFARSSAEKAHLQNKVKELKKLEEKVKKSDIKVSQVIEKADKTQSKSS